uniref:Uncharacterized protein n=1 Tax=Pithovirus LCPAC404 TaxID=2506597 RepID=A0A481ZBM9_9VIRU|nr:MAG: hypothetical protein LCPAC404_00470 [Pithovirus LCPAC404]
MSVKLECSALEKIMEGINEKLKRTRYTIVCISDSVEYRGLGLVPMLNKDLTFDISCHEDIQTCSVDDTTLKCFAIAIMSPDGTVVSYLTFTVERNREKFVLINFSCTQTEERRLGLSMILRVVPFLFARSHNIRFVASDTNLASGSLLKNKFNFTVTDDYQSMFNYVAKSHVDVTTEDFKKILSERMREIGIKYPRI